MQESDRTGRLGLEEREGESRTAFLVYTDETANFSAALNEADSLRRSYHLIPAPLWGPLMSPRFLTDA